MRVILLILMVLIPLSTSSKLLVVPEKPMVKIEQDTFQQDVDLIIQKHIDKVLEVQTYLKEQEGLTLLPYPDGAGYSVGYGHQIRSIDKLSFPLTKHEADSLFNDDFKLFYQESIRLYPDLEFHQRLAITAFMFNVGYPKGNLHYQLENQLSITSIFSYTKYKGEFHPVLYKRRRWEYDYYCTK